jgi:hypothetical protein
MNSDPWVLDLRGPFHSISDLNSPVEERSDIEYRY